jgi:5-oxopent-3-ene-1,2,5-tricarboxylate decarboxylase / 2-hydroxyhepta-2,4-diene-1,7-dioate isomerase
MINPNNIHGLALNYKGVGKDDNQTPLYFIKSQSSFCTNKTSIEYPFGSDFMWTEVELGIVISKYCKNIELIEASNYIKGFVVSADISCSNVFGRDHHLAFSKSRKGFCPTSNEVIQIPDSKWSDLKLTTEINGNLTQEGNTNSMLYNPGDIIHYLSKITTLEEGDLILTGTPPGWKNNKLQVGDKVIQKIEMIGDLQYDII